MLADVVQFSIFDKFGGGGGGEGLRERSGENVVACDLPRCRHQSRSVCHLSVRRQFRLPALTLLVHRTVVHATEINVELHETPRLAHRLCNMPSAFDVRTSLVRLENRRC